MVIVDLSNFDLLLKVQVRFFPSPVAFKSVSLGCELLVSAGDGDPS